MMGYLPYFADLPMDEVLDLRRELRPSLIRFRSALTQLSRDFESRLFDPAFEAEVKQAWRVHVEPSLLEIRETLADHGLLNGVASVVLGDPRRLVAEVGGVLVVSWGGVVPMSEMITAAVAAGLPALDAVGKGLLGREGARVQVRRNAFYFLHRLDEASR